MVKIVNVELENIQEFRTIIEILNGFVPEANADFIKDANEYNNKIDQKNNKDKDDDDEDNDNDDEDDDSKSTKKKSSKDIKDSSSSKKLKKEVKEVKESKKDTKDTKDSKKESKDAKDGKKSKDSKKDKIESKSKKEKEKDKKKKSKKSKDDSDDDSDKESDISDISDISESEEAKKQEDNPGQIKILTTDQNRVLITYIILKASGFKKFEILPDEYRVGLNLDELYKYMKNVDKDGIMSIYIDNEDTQNIIFNVSNNQAPKVSICELRVMNLTKRKRRKIEANFSMAVRMPCDDFHKTCKDLSQFSSHVEITCDPSQFTVTCQGDMSTHSRIFKCDGSENGIVIKSIGNNDANKLNIIRLIFDLKYINMMYKCSNLCDDMQIYLNSNSVMFLKYDINLLGEMLVGISPAIGNKIKSNDNYDDQMDKHYDDDDDIKML